MTLYFININDINTKKINEGKRYDFGDGPEMVLAVSVLKNQDRIWIKTEKRELLYRCSGEIIGSADYVKRVIIAEDDPELSATLHHLIGLFETCFIPHVVSNGLDALNLFHEVGANLIVTDHIMPILNGESLIEIIRATNVKVPIILISVDKETVHKFNDRLDSNLYCLLKPFKTTELEKIVEGIFI